MLLDRRDGYFVRDMYPEPEEDKGVLTETFGIINIIFNFVPCYKSHIVL